MEHFPAALEPFKGLIAIACIQILHDRGKNSLPSLCRMHQDPSGCGPWQAICSVPQSSLFLEVPSVGP